VPVVQKSFSDEYKIKTPFDVEYNCGLATARTSKGGYSNE